MHCQKGQNIIKNKNIEKYTMPKQWKYNKNQTIEKLTTWKRL